MPRPVLPANLAGKLSRLFLRPQMLAFLPALVLAGYWWGGEGVLTLFAVTFPMLLLILGMFEHDPAAGRRDALTGLATREALLEAAEAAMADPGGDGQASIILAVELDEAEDLRSHLGPAGFETVIRRVADRLTGAARKGDPVARIGETRFALLLPSVRGSGMEVALGAAERLQAAVSEAISVDAASVYVTCSVGFCLARRVPEPHGAALIAAAELALDEARRAGQSAVRAYSPAMGERRAVRQGTATDLARAFDQGEIRPWFQPQISTETGEITGMEALARWVHPERGLLPPAEFLPTLEATGQMDRLGETMLFHGLSALRAWDRAGLHVPQLALNQSGAELRNPRLVDRIRWELDRFDMAADRLAIEVLETVMVRPGDDSVTANLAALAALGCAIDLDDFGTGHAAIGNIRRFAVRRIKIDRSFVARVDQDRAQQQMVTAILSMAAELDLETLAEGVETAGERAMLAQLGCHHLQGYAIARPMPFDDTIDWLRRHREKLALTPRIGTGTA
jgi:diguanylate cyclase (GGDEF)-like protein